MGDTAGPVHAGWIQASEIAQYVYCRRAWWLHRVRGYSSNNPRALDEGREFHARHGRAVATALQWQRVGYVLLGIGGLVGIGVLWLVLGSGW